MNRGCGGEREEFERVKRERSAFRLRGSIAPGVSSRGVPVRRDPPGGEVFWVPEDLKIRSVDPEDHPQPQTSPQNH
ncbi:unnamed protein product [Arctogadus glacialis]